MLGFLGIYTCFAIFKTIFKTVDMPGCLGISFNQLGQIKKNIPGI